MASGTGQALEARRAGWLAWLVLAVAWFATAPVRPLLDPDEGRYAEIPREMLASGDLVTPRFDGLKYFEKPPLQYWATAAVYALAGLSEWSSRLWSVGLAFGCLALTFSWTRALYGHEAALAALTALAVSPYFLVVGHLNLLDAGLTFWLSAAVFAFTLAQSAAPSSSAERRWMLAAWAAAALAVLSKGIVVGVLAGGALIVYSLIERDPQPWRRLHPASGLPLFLGITAPWFIAVSARNPGFAGFFFVHEHFARFLTTVHQRVEPWWFFLPLLLLGVLPWVAPLPGALKAAWRDGPRPAPGTAAGSAAAGFKPRKFLLVFAAVTLVFFSASGSKLAPYILPMFPALAGLVGVHAAGSGRLWAPAARIGAALVVLIAAGLLIYSARRNAFVPAEAVGWVLAASLIALVPAILTRRGGRLPAPAAALATALAAILAWQCLLTAYAIIPPTRSARDLVAAARPWVGPQTALYSVGQYRETVSPYLGRTLTLVDYEGELAFGLRAEPGRNDLSVADFMARWGASRDAVAFFDPGIWDSWRRRGFPGRVVAADNYTVAVSRL
ncbi:MAG TPA: phospholipid carrier-dependent glycosyltransferase [Steroidobacteraceae bacterium]|nr:phospholipid carrier-dependent glycosyltransferase [Steroidobacteraceae bacterium]